jgi:hypothetical protein
MTKTELLQALEDSRQELIEMLEALPEEALTLPVRKDGWTIKDILAHLTNWEGQNVTLLFQAQRGTARPSTAHFGTETFDAVNQRWFEASQQRSLDMIWQDWIGVRKQVIRRVGELSEKDLTDPSRFPWMKGKPLFELILTDTIEHEEEHADEIREWLEQFDTPSSSGDNGKQA